MNTYLGVMGKMLSVILIMCYVKLFRYCTNMETKDA